MKLIHGLNFKNIKGDLLGGITAAVVALPLAIAFGETALGDGGAIYGMYGAIIVGFLAALFWWNSISSKWSNWTNEYGCTRAMWSFCYF